MKYGLACTNQFEKDIKGILSEEPPGSFSLTRKEHFYDDPFIQSLWVGYQLGMVRAKLQAGNKEEKKVPALCKAVDFEYNGIYEQD
jgi:hypothetical protein